MNASKIQKNSENLSGPAMFSGERVFVSMGKIENKQSKMLALTKMEIEKKETTEHSLKIKPDLRGVLEPRLVRIISFTVITISLVACTVLCILAIWKFTESDAVWRAIATFIVVSVATGIFTFVNEKLG